MPKLRCGRKCIRPIISFSLSTPFSSRDLATVVSGSPVCTSRFLSRPLGHFKTRNCFWFFSVSMTENAKNEIKIKRVRLARVAWDPRHVCKEHMFEYFINLTACVVRLHAVDSQTGWSGLLLLELFYTMGQKVTSLSATPAWCHVNCYVYLY